MGGGVSRVNAAAAGAGTAASAASNPLSSTEMRTYNSAGDQRRTSQADALAAPPPPPPRPSGNVTVNPRQGMRDYQAHIQQQQQQRQQVSEEEGDSGRERVATVAHTQQDGLPAHDSRHGPSVVPTLPALAPSPSASAVPHTAHQGLTTHTHEQQPPADESVSASHTVASPRAAAPARLQPLNAPGEPHENAEEEAARTPRRSPDAVDPTMTTTTIHAEAAVAPSLLTSGADGDRTGALLASGYHPCSRSASPGTALAAGYSGLPLNELQQELRGTHRVLRLCLTGGPCAGKSTMLAQIQTKIPQRTGYQVYCVPEAATLLVTGGMQWDGDIAMEQQLALLRTQLALEDQFFALAVASGKPTLVVSDRGTMDGRAFCSPEAFQQILDRLGCTLDVLRDRYDAVVHMVTAACGAEAFYNLDNPARYEDLDGARASDEKLRQVYVGHPFLRILDNATSFEEKVERGLRIVSQVVGQDNGSQKTSYFLLRSCPPARELPIPCAASRVRTTVLSNSQLDEVRMVQLRIMPDGSRMHFFKSLRKAPLGVSATEDAPGAPPHDAADDRRSWTTARHRSNSSSSLSMLMAGGAVAAAAAAESAMTRQAAPTHVESALRISSKEYRCLVRNRDPLREVVEAETVHFIYEGANFEATTLLRPSWAAGKQTLSVEYDATGAQLDGARSMNASDSECTGLPPIPAFLQVDREVPLETATTAFLISHRETGRLYTALAFAPVFASRQQQQQQQVAGLLHSTPQLLQRRGSVSALGPHADAVNIIASTQSTPLRAAAAPGGPADRTMTDASAAGDLSELQRRASSVSGGSASQRGEDATADEQAPVQQKPAGLTQRNVNTTLSVPPKKTKSSLKVLGANVDRAAVSERKSTRQDPVSAA